MKNRKKIERLLNKTKLLAKQYRVLTGKPLGITGEVAEFTAAILLNLELTNARQPGYDAIKRIKRRTIRYQIKGRALPENAKPGQRIGSIKFNHKWDYVLLILMDSDLNVISIYQAPRTAIKRELMRPGSRVRNKRGALSVNVFKRIGKRVWHKK